MGGVLRQLPGLLQQGPQLLLSAAQGLDPLRVPLRQRLMAQLPQPPGHGLRLRAYCGDNSCIVISTASSLLCAWVNVVSVPVYVKNSRRRRKFLLTNGVESGNMIFAGQTLV